ncbi:MAG: peptide/nickel transport system ATP-binding protein [Acidobacteriaceae bacterium]|nr:peptide/nickel transport system ATP-binding protein [Acidobacteriaceae bacterium]
MATLLEVDRLSIYYRDQAVVRDLTFSVAQGEVLGLVGESGSGKSLTSLSIVRLLDHAARVEGAIRFEGQDLLTLKPEQMRRYRGRKIAMIFQEPMTALNPVMPVGRQIAEAIEAHQPELSRKQVRDAVVEAMTAVAIAEPEHRRRDYPHQFSGGQRQRLLIAMALVNHPSLLIADEPTTALDVTVQAQILLLLKNLQQRNGLGMLFISHDLAVVAQVADRVAVMRGGMLLETGTRDQVFLHPRHAYTKSLLGAVPTLTTDRNQPLATLTAADTTAGILLEQAPGHWVRSAGPV